MNLPVEIQNGVGVAGGQVMGWLPIVSIHESHTCSTLDIQLRTISLGQQRSKG